MFAYESPELWGGGQKVHKPSPIVGDHFGAELFANPVRVLEEAESEPFHPLNFVRWVERTE